MFKSFLISDNEDIQLGLRLAGISGVVVDGREEIVKCLKEILAQKNIGIVIITESIFEKVKNEILEIKLKRKLPLIVTIPGINGLKDENFITKYIKESVGVKL